MIMLTVTFLFSTLMLLWGLIRQLDKNTKDREAFGQQESALRYILDAERSQHRIAQQHLEEGLLDARAGLKMSELDFDLVLATARTKREHAARHKRVL